MGVKELNNSYIKLVVYLAALELPHAGGPVRVGLCRDSAPSGKTAFRCTPALRMSFSRNPRCNRHRANIYQEIHEYPRKSTPGCQQTVLVSIY